MIDEYGDVVSSAFTIWNNKAGFEYLMEKIREVEIDMKKVKVGLEATGHYSLNILEFLMKNLSHKGLQIVVGGMKDRQEAEDLMALARKLAH